MVLKREVGDEADCLCWQGNRPRANRNLRWPEEADSRNYCASMRDHAFIITCVVARTRILALRRRLGRHHPLDRLLREKLAFDFDLDLIAHEESTGLERDVPVDADILS